MFQDDKGAARTTPGIPLHLFDFTFYSSSTAIVLILTWAEDAWATKESTLPDQEIVAAEVFAAALELLSVRTVISAHFPASVQVSTTLLIFLPAGGLIKRTEL